MIPSNFYRGPGSYLEPGEEPWHGKYCGCPRCFVEHERRHGYDSRRTERARREWAKQEREPQRQQEREPRRTQSFTRMPEHSTRRNGRPSSPSFARS